MRCVLDTNVIVAAMRSPSGASAELLRMARREQIQLVANVALAIEYEAVCKLAEHQLAAGLETKEVDAFLDAVVAMIDPVETHFMWRPELRDPADEFVLEAAVNGRADAIVTFNLRDFGIIPKRFGVALLKPLDIVRRSLP